MNKGSLANIAKNINRLLTNNDSLRKITFHPTEIGTWDDFYNWSQSENKYTDYVYDAVIILQFHNIVLTRSIVIKTAFMLANCSHWYQWSRRREVCCAVDLLIDKADILRPAQGLIAAKGTKKNRDQSEYIHNLFSILKTSLNKKSKRLNESLLSLGRSSLSLKKFREAFRVYRYIIKRLDGKSIDALDGIGKAYEGLGKSEKALEKYNSILELDGCNYKALYQKGRLLLAQKETLVGNGTDTENLKEACSCFEKAMEVQPYNHDVLVQLGKSYGPIDRITARDYFAKAMLFSDDPAIALEYESIGFKAEEINAAREELVTVTKKPIEEKDFLKCFFIGNDLRIKKNAYEDAIQYYKQATNLAPSFAHAWFGMGLAYARLPGGVDKALRCYKKARKPGFQKQWIEYNLGEIHRAAGKYHTAIKHYLCAIKADGEYVDAYYAAGLSYFEISDYLRAVLYYSEALSCCNNQREYVFFDRGRARAKLDQHEIAIADFSETLKRDRSCVRALHHRGLSYAKLKKNEYAIKDYNCALNIFEYPREEILLNQAKCLYKMEKYSEAIQSCNKVAEYLRQEEIFGKSNQYNERELKKKIAQAEYLMAKCYIYDAVSTENEDKCFKHLEQAIKIGGEEYKIKVRDDNELKILRGSDRFTDIMPGYCNDC
ncbi:MAG: tetratricopeptide repeat protein [Candidatus Electrothrix sp. ATG2]|nr:tetratricopeptide repeat protein [Candidatus Electrothrix sp. ATG2]